MDVDDVKVDIISVGDEIVIGDIVNTNAAWIGKKLLEIGILTNRIVAVGDQYQSIKSAIEYSLDNADIVLVTGGLGPTSDDKTKAVLVDVFHTSLVYYPDHMKIIRKHYDKIHRLSVPELVKEQAWYPADCRIIQNEIGTANGMVFRKNDTELYALPGVPMEMKVMMKKVILPELSKRIRKDFLVRYIRTVGLLESEISDRLASVEKKYPEITISYLPNAQGVDLRLMCKIQEPGMAEDRFQQAGEEIIRGLGRNVYSTSRNTLEEIIGEHMKKHHLTLSVAESCTGGLIADRITNVPGSSAYFIMGAVTYSNRAKEKFLGIASDVIKRYGAVSDVVARSMAEGIRRISDSHWGLATTGIAGPGGGSGNKPVGLVWIGCSGPQKTVVEKHVFSGDRLFNKHRFAQAAMDLLRRMLYD